SPVEPGKLRADDPEWKREEQQADLEVHVIGPVNAFDRRGSELADRERERQPDDVGDEQSTADQPSATPEPEPPFVSLRSCLGAESPVYACAAGGDLGRAHD